MSGRTSGGGRACAALKCMPIPSAPQTPPGKEVLVRRSALVLVLSEAVLVLSEAVLVLSEAVLVLSEAVLVLSEAVLGPKPRPHNAC